MTVTPIIVVASYIPEEGDGCRYTSSQAGIPAAGAAEIHESRLDHGSVEPNEDRKTIMRNIIRRGTYNDMSENDDSVLGPLSSSEGSDTSFETLEQGEFPGYFVQRSGRLYHSHCSAPYPLPVDGEEQQVSGMTKSAARAKP